MEQVQENIQPIGEKSIAGSQTEKNLQTAVSGEGLAFARYMIYAEHARGDGYHEIATLFENTANNEKSHAELWLRYLKAIGTTRENLITAAGGEHYEWSSMYKNFSEVALAEGFRELAGKLKLVAQVEEVHENNYNTFVKDLDTGTVFRKDDPIVWTCSKCGYKVEGEYAPKICPVCGRPQSYFMQNPN